ncbi:ABC transporter permease [Flavisolibacter tropicus]|uniref:Macrolide export ATP-binding/permease MacB n=1 Tax=Flavisolibacter tropicus TaxID=1492898 RepID=A0A172TRP5_9BACT|nr:ABC transporter permease [Flavisolibacter tropicus]ANE49741.1 macrolide export ATP-binding/permease MacB [Flavisolibacter tropicus]
MLRNYLKIAIRNLMKHKFISGINLFGLTVGVTCCLLILSYIIHELSYDKYQSKAENIYRVNRTFINPETGDINLALSAVAPPFGPLFVNDFPAIKKMTRVLQNGNTAFRYEEKRFNERDVYFADENFFDVFDVAVLKGNKDKALDDPYTVLLTEEVARKYFGTSDPINKVVRLDNQIDAKVTGVYKAFPSNSHFHPQIMISFNTLKDTAIYGEERLRTNFGNNSFYTYLLVPEDYKIKNLEAQMPAFLDRHIPSEGDKFKPSQWTSLSFTKLTDIHLRSHKDDEMEENGDIKRVYIFSAIALFILLIACINYMNLSTARSIIRAKEIGVRKTIGASKQELIAQFLSESVLISWIATILAFILTWLLMPWLNELSGLSLSVKSLLQWQIIVPLLFIPFIVGIISGLYPAVFLSSFQPVKVLKGIIKVDNHVFSFRKVLVVLQFAISIILIVSTIVVFQQLRFMQNKSLGFDRDHVVVLGYNSALAEHYEGFRNEMTSNTLIKEVGRSSRIPTGRLLDAMGAQIKRGDSLAPSGADIKMVVGDDGFLSTYGVKVVAGRNLSRSNGLRDTSAFLVNEAGVKALGLKSPEEAVGKEFQYGRRKGEIVGVFHDFHFESMHERILPIAFLMPVGRTSYAQLSIKLSGQNIPAALNHIENTWKKFLPEVPFEYTFLEENFNRLYEAEQRQKAIFTVFACIAIFIASLGLLGLSAFAIGQRIKEIGIRKVLGADVKSIVGLLSADFMKLVIVAAIIAFPIAWYIMHQWLQDFAYRIGISWWFFLVAGIVAAIIAFITISFQTVKAASANPVKNLRTE